MTDFLLVAILVQLTLVVWLLADIRANTRSKVN
jgi:hypothetical protein